MNQEEALRRARLIVQLAEERAAARTAKTKNRLLFRLYATAADLEAAGIGLSPLLESHLEHPSPDVRCTLAALLLREKNDKAVRVLEELVLAEDVRGFSPVTAKYTLFEWRAGRLAPLSTLVENARRSESR